MCFVQVQLHNSMHYHETSHKFDVNIKCANSMLLKCCCWASWMRITDKIMNFQNCFYHIRTSLPISLSRSILVSHSNALYLFLTSFLALSSSLSLSPSRSLTLSPSRSLTFSTSSPLALSRALSHSSGNDLAEVSMPRACKILHIKRIAWGFRLLPSTWWWFYVNS